MGGAEQAREGRLPETPIGRWMRPIAAFLHIESASGMVLLGCTVLALILANSASAADFAGIWQIHFRIGIGDFNLDKPLILWINDGLMALFFFVVGLEIKRELVAGELQDPRKAALPVMAALGGMIVPAVVYVALRGGHEGSEGWAIPMATDIAFVVGFLALFGQRVPFGLKILLLSLAIVDDIGAILVIAIFYTSHLSLTALALAGAGLVLVVIFRLIGVRLTALYVVVGAAIWLGFLKSGVHPTVAGVILGLLTPSSPFVDGPTLRGVAREADRAGGTRESLGRLELAARESVSPLERLEHTLHPWVAFVIMPIFALANAGVAVDPSGLGHPVALASALGLVVGKSVGILLFSWLAVRFGIARLPEGVSWTAMIGAGFLGGIGFTMALFIAGLAFPDQLELLDAGKIGVLIGSGDSAAIGCVILAKCLPTRADE